MTRQRGNRTGFRYVNRFGIGVDRADRQGLDPDGGAWVATCVDHGTLVNVPTKREGMTTAGVDFCDGCRDALPADVDQPAAPELDAAALLASPDNDRDLKTWEAELTRDDLVRVGLVCRGIGE